MTVQYLPRFCRRRRKQPIRLGGMYPVGLFAALVFGVMALAVPKAARAAAPYQGTYVIVDPYDQFTITMLQGAAQTPCLPAQQQATTPFCGATNGILLRLSWCDFQLYHVNNSKGQPLPSCHYQVGWKSGSSGPGAQIISTDKVSPCSGSYDICTGAHRSVLGGTLHIIAQINTQRAAAGLPPLNLSVGMYAGFGTPQSVLDAVGYVDVPFSTSASGDPAANQCVRLPLPWKSQFVTSYEQASDQLLSYIQAQFPGGAHITLVKPAAIVASDLEIDEPGRATAIPVATDPGPAGPGPALTCPAGNAAQVWLDAYNQNPVSGKTYSQAQESTFGSVIGHYWAKLASMGLYNVALSIPTTNGQAFPAIDCGSQGDQSCSVRDSSSGNWSIYYFEQYVADLFNGGLAYSQAAAAYQQLRGDTFSLAPSQLAINATALSVTAVPSAQQVECNLNNVSPSHAATFRLDNVNQMMMGVGTLLGWQTSPLQGPECAAGTYGTALENGVSNGALFLEVQNDAAFTYIAQCSAPLSRALSELMAAGPQTNCVY